nr:unnamed protein product [Digitaria exilis]
MSWLARLYTCIHEPFVFCSGNGEWRGTTYHREGMLGLC